MSRFKAEPFPDRLAILPSDRYRFGATAPDGQAFTVVASGTLPSGARVLALNVGLLAFDFSNDPQLGGVTIHRQTAGVEVPQEVMDSRDNALKAQGARMRLATFVTACIFGVHAFETHSSIVDAQFPGYDAIFNWVDLAGRFGVPSFDTERLATRLLRRSGRREFIPVAHIESGLDLARRLIDAAPTYETADPVSLIVMTYQAMILHNRQHAGASIALQALVSEGAIEELVQASGLVRGVAARLPNPVVEATLSKREARNLGFNGGITTLHEAGLIDNYLVTRLNALRGARNTLMHEAQDPAPGQSGEGLTAVRDLLRLCLLETGFELNMSWSYRI